MNLTVFGGDIAISAINRIWMSHLTGHILAYFGRFIYFVYDP